MVLRFEATKTVSDVLHRQQYSYKLTSEGIATRQLEHTGSFIKQEEAPKIFLWAQTVKSFMN